jgi:hypothetical protein
VPPAQVVEQVVGANGAARLGRKAHARKDVQDAHGVRILSAGRRPIGPTWYESLVRSLPSASHVNDLTVIVVSHQSAQDLGDCLTSLFAFPPGPSDGVATGSSRALVWLSQSQALLARAAFMLRWGRRSVHPS